MLIEPTRSEISELLNATPPAFAVAVRGRDAWSWIVTKCPHCGREHRHGGGIGEAPAFLGHRVAHCNERRGYVLVLEPQQ